MVKRCFKNLRIAVLGRPAAGTPEAVQFKDLMDTEDVEQRICNNGGEVVKKVDKKTNIVIVSRAEWYARHFEVVKGETGGQVKNEVNRVYQMSRKRDGQSIKFVTWEWLNDSLRAEKARSPKNYNPNKAIKEATKQQRLIKRQERFEKRSTDEAYLDLDARTHHIYKDDSGFIYDITLVRINLEQNYNESYRMKIYESNTVPRLYAGMVRYSHKGADARHGEKKVLAAPSSYFKQTWDSFLKFFKEKCGYSWYDRADHYGTLGQPGRFHLVAPKHLKSLPIGLVSDWILKDGAGDEGRTSFDGVDKAAENVEGGVPEPKNDEEREVRFQKATEIYHKQRGEEAEMVKGLDAVQKRRLLELIEVVGGSEDAATSREEPDDGTALVSKSAKYWLGNDKVEQQQESKGVLSAAAADHQAMVQKGYSAELIQQIIDEETKQSEELEA